MPAVGRWGNWILVIAASAAILPGTAGASERYEDLFFFHTVRAQTGLAAFWDFSRNTPSRDQVAGEYVIEVNEGAAWNVLFRESWKAAGDASQIVPRPAFEVLAGPNGALTFTATGSGGLTARLGAPAQPLQVPGTGASKIDVQFRKISIERGRSKASGWVVHETAIDDTLGSRQIERIALWDGFGGAIYFTLRDDQALVAARVDSAGNVASANTSIARWTKTAEDPAGPKYGSSWTLMVPEWKWQAVVTAEGTASISGGQIVQRIAGAATGPGGSTRLWGVDELRLH